MNNYTNFSHLPHKLKITNRKSGQVIINKEFKNERDALAYLEEARNYQDNRRKLNFTISGPNMFYSV